MTEGNIEWALQKERERVAREQDLIRPRGQGRKDDASKPRFELLPWDTIVCVVRVLTLGAVKYADDNWKRVPNARSRYFGAAMRHLTAWWEGELLDPETQEPHLAHAICCLVFLLWFDLNANIVQEPIVKCIYCGGQHASPSCYQLKDKP